MRRVLLIAHRVPVSGAFTLNDLAGGGGRMDEIARCVSTFFSLSNALRQDVELTILFVAQPPPKARRIEVVGNRLRYLNPDERSTAALLKNALVRSIPLDRDVESSPGIRVGPVDPGPSIRAFAQHAGTFWLSEDGHPYRGSPLLDGGFSAILSDPTDPTPDEVEELKSLGIPKLSLGPRSMRSSQCLDVLNHESDLRELERPRDPVR
ncbi:MAG: tRNA (pseudouridine(54)-N(1))-methyltransferase TrmY [Thermoplasmata archaeon]|nr:tRNA (pseudouridine(54)-N(1))-methyltransferase TrmY [Thermoplasmata archaeon]MCI4359975.1 tRNA (pseudouridine(54)-N(1))-methyltransferase TrmY [Thermoplasmata archaeon]